MHSVKSCHTHTHMHGLHVSFQLSQPGLSFLSVTHCIICLSVPLCELAATLPCPSKACSTIGPLPIDSVTHTHTHRVAHICMYPNRLQMHTRRHRKMHGGLFSHFQNQMLPVLCVCFVFVFFFRDPFCSLKCDTPYFKHF